MWCDGKYFTCVSVLLLLLLFFFYSSSFVASTLYAFPLDDLHSLDLPSKRFSITFQAMRVWVYVRRHTRMLRCILYFILINLFDYHMNRSKRTKNTNTRRGRKRKKNTYPTRNLSPFSMHSALYLSCVISTFLCLCFFFVFVCLFVWCASPTYYWISVALSQNGWNVRRNLFFDTRENVGNFMLFFILFLS